MPRGRKKVEVAPQDLLNEVLTSIEETEQKLKTLKMQKKDIEKQIEAKAVSYTHLMIPQRKYVVPKTTSLLIPYTMTSGSEE